MTQVGGFCTAAGMERVVRDALCPDNLWFPAAARGLETPVLVPPEPHVSVPTQGCPLTIPTHCLAAKYEYMVWSPIWRVLLSP